MVNIKLHWLLLWDQHKGGPIIGSWFSKSLVPASPTNLRLQIIHYIIQRHWIILYYSPWRSCKEKNVYLTTLFGESALHFFFTVSTVGRIHNVRDFVIENKGLQLVLRRCQAIFLGRLEAGLTLCSKQRPRKYWFSIWAANISLKNSIIG